MSIKRHFFGLFIFCAVVLGLGRSALSQPLSIDLDKAFELALVSDKGVKTAESDAAKAYEGRRQAHGSRGVKLKVEHDTARARNQRQDIYVNTFSNVISATYPLYTGGLLEGSIAVSEHEFISKIQSLERARQELKLSVATAFFTMLRTKDMSELAYNAVERLEAHVRNVDVQYKNGRVGKADLLRSEVELINAKQSMSQAVNEYKIAVKNLNSVIGLSLDTELFYEGKMSYAAFPYALDECLEYAFSGHPNLAIAKSLEGKAKAGIIVAESDRKPKVTLAASQILNSPNNWPGLDQDNLQIALHAEYTFSDAGVTASKIRSAREDLKIAGYNYESIRDTIILDVTKCFMTMEEARTRIEMGAFDKAQEAYRISLARYREGVGTNLDVLDAQAALQQADSDHTQALCDYNIAVAQIENAVGVPMPFILNTTLQ